MAYQELGMWEVLDVLRRVHRGETRSGIERATGRTRKTIHRSVVSDRIHNKISWLGLLGDVSAGAMSVSS